MQPLTDSARFWGYFLAGQPRYIETVARKGYRFVVEVNVSGASLPNAPRLATEELPSPPDPEMALGCRASHSDFTGGCQCSLAVSQRKARHADSVDARTRPQHGSCGLARRKASGLRLGRRREASSPLGPTIRCIANSVELTHDDADEREPSFSRRMEPPSSSSTPQKTAAAYTRYP